MGFLHRAYKDYNIFVFLSFLWTFLYSFIHLIDDAWLLWHITDASYAEEIRKLFLHILTIVGSIIILKERIEGVILWILAPFIACGLAYLLFKTNVKNADAISYALYILFPLILLLLKQNNISGWKVLAKRKPNNL